MTLLAEIALIVVAAVAVVCRSRSCPAVVARPASTGGPGSGATEPVGRDRAAARDGPSERSPGARLSAPDPCRDRFAAAGRERTDARPDARRHRPADPGDDLWEIVRLDRPFPEDRHGPGVAPQDAGGDARGARAAMNGALSPRMRGLLALGGCGLVAGARQRACGARGARHALPRVRRAGPGLAREPQLTAHIDLERTRLLEAERVAATVTLVNDGAHPVEVELALVGTEELVVEPAGPILLHMAGGATVTVEVSLRPERWGAHAWVRS